MKDRSINTTRSANPRQEILTGAMIFDANLIQDMIASYGYAAVFVVVLLESSGIPLPGETILICASVYAGTQHGLDIRVIIGAAASGAILGDNVGFWIGRRFGRTLLMKYGHYVEVDRQKLALGEYLFMRFGGMIVFFGRFVALLRVYAALLAGIEPSQAGRFRGLQCSGRRGLGSDVRNRWLPVRQEFAAFRRPDRMDRFSRIRSGRLLPLGVL